MIEAMVAFWIILFSLRALLSKDNGETVEYLFISFVMLSFYFFFRLEKEDLVFFIPIIMIFVLFLGTFYLDFNKRSRR